MSTILKGMFLHTFDEAGKMQWQGHIVEADKEVCAVQLFSWGFGEPTEVKIMPTSVILGPTVKLYSTQNDWRRAAFENQRAEGLTAPGLTWAEMQNRYSAIERA